MEIQEGTLTSRPDSRTHTCKRLDRPYYWGRVQSLYINKLVAGKRRMVTVGQLCKDCGAVSLLPEFYKDLDKVIIEAAKDGQAENTS